MATKNNNDDETESLPGDGDASPPPQSRRDSPENPAAQAAGNQVFKSGYLFLSSKGIGWTSWKKRWFILTRTSLVFYRSDPSIAPQKSSEANLILGGIDLNNSGSVLVKADKKLLTVSFPDGREGRTFTLKAETSEDLYEWKTALETALAQAPSAAVASQNGIFKNDQAADGVDSSSEQSKEASKSTVFGRPIMLALEEADGSPSFLEKALKFVEEHGVRTEGILRQAADVEDVERRIREYEQGKTEFSPEEDGHVIADCVKYVLRELPSYPIPASCCKALLEACRSERGNRANAMKMAICETFPEPNRRLLQRILVMMQIVASNKAMNRMSISAVAACMAPLLLRPLLSGDCEIETDFNVGGDGSLQLLQAAAAANHAQAIVITLLEEYDTIFGEGSMSPGLYSDSEDYESEDEEFTDDESYIEDDNESDAHTDDNESIAIVDDSGDSCEDDLSDNEDEVKKNLSTESTDCTADDEAEIQKLEARKLELQKKIAEEVKNNAALQANLVQRMKALQEHRQSLAEDVLRLQEQLQKERDKRTALEAQINAAEGSLPVSDTIDEKTKAEIEEMIRAEAEVANLKQKVEGLFRQLNQQYEQNNGSMNDSSNQPPIQTSNQQGKKKDKKKDCESSFPSILGSSISKDNYVDRVDGENENKYESFLSGKHPPQHPDAARSSRSKSLASTSSKKSSTKNEGTLTKLTNRLNFMKARGPEVQNSETDEGNSTEGQHPPTLEKGRSDGHVSINFDKAQGPGAKPQSTPRTNSR